MAAEALVLGGGDAPGLEVADAGRTVDIPLGEVTALRPVSTCGA